MFFVSYDRLVLICYHIGHLLNRNPAFEEHMQQDKPTGVDLLAIVIMVINGIFAVFSGLTR
jgi:hypothetical protein